MHMFLEKEDKDWLFPMSLGVNWILMSSQITGKFQLENTCFDFLNGPAIFYHPYKILKQKECSQLQPEYLKSLIITEHEWEGGFLYFFGLLSCRKVFKNQFFPAVEKIYIGSFSDIKIISLFDWLFNPFMVAWQYSEIRLTKS